MKVISSTGNPELATVHVGELEDRSRIEFCESVQPPKKRNEKWVNIISTMVGCPVGCKMCDAGGGFVRFLTAQEMQEQINYLGSQTFLDDQVHLEGKIPSKVWKIQLARMGEPTLNPHVLEFLRELGEKGHENLVISLSTVGPSACAPFIQELKKLKDAYFQGKFQLQFSIHTTDDEARRRIIPIRGLILPEIAALGRQFRSPGDRKITLNFIVMKDVPIDADRIARLFDPENFLIKLTPLNPTYRAQYHKIQPGFDPERPASIQGLVSEFESKGFETILSIGEMEENQIGSNCGQYLESLNRSA
ncbi:MAG: radical SAM protein [Thermoplasmata archaeon]|nr:radical SAM protein [Thermoplasmata archaeon]